MDQNLDHLQNSMTRQTSNNISVKYTLEPSKKAIEIIRKSQHGKYPDMPINMLWAIISHNEEEKGVIAMSPIYGSVWTAHIASTYPLFGRSLLRTCEMILRKCVETLNVKTILLFPDNTLARRMASKLEFKISETKPLIMIRNF